MSCTTHRPCTVWSPSFKRWMSYVTPLQLVSFEGPPPPPLPLLPPRSPGGAGGGPPAWPWRGSKSRRPPPSLRSTLVALTAANALRRYLEGVDRGLVAESVEGGPCSTSGAWEVVVALWTYPPKRAGSTGALFRGTAMLRTPPWAAYRSPAWVPIEWFEFDTSGKFEIPP